MTHGIYSRPHAIERGALAEDPSEVKSFIDGLIDDLAPRDTQELAVARRIAEGELRLARADRFENVGLNAAGRLSKYQTTQGIGEELFLGNWGKSFLRASDVIYGRVAPDENVGWREVAEHIWMLQGKPFTTEDFPEDGDGTEAASETERMYVYTVLIPRFWKHYEGAALALRTKADELLGKYNETAGVAEELAVEKALAPGGVMDRASILRGRTLKGLERDRATYEKLRERDLGEGCDGDEE